MSHHDPGKRRALAQASPAGSTTQAPGLHGLLLAARDIDAKSRLIPRTAERPTRPARTGDRMDPMTAITLDKDCLFAEKITLR